MSSNIKTYKVVVIGAGAAGLMAAITAAKRGKKVLLIESTNKIGEKIRISGGGRCNFTNINAGPNNYLSNNPHFVKSALAQYNQYDFIKLVEGYKIAYHEKTLGQLFCDYSSNQIIEMLVNECTKYNVEILLNTQISLVSKDQLFKLETSRGNFESEALIIATGGLSIPKIGASSFGYDLAKQFGHNIIPTRPGLVPLTVSLEDLEFYKNLSGISIDSIVSFEKTKFRENILFTHRGLSGPAILQISSYLAKQNSEIITPFFASSLTEARKELEIGDLVNILKIPGRAALRLARDDEFSVDRAMRLGIISIDLLPEVDLYSLLEKNKNSKMLLTNFMKEYLPNRFVDNYFENKRLVDLSAKAIEITANKVHQFKVSIGGTEGYAKAEVTIGGVDTKELSSKTMMSNKVPNLYFIGEVVDVTGWLGGYNFQWAWSSGFVAGSHT